MLIHVDVLHVHTRWTGLQICVSHWLHCTQIPLRQPSINKRKHVYVYCKFYPTLYMCTHNKYLQNCKNDVQLSLMYQVSFSSICLTKSLSFPSSLSLPLSLPLSLSTCNHLSIYLSLPPSPPFSTSPSLPVYLSSSTEMLNGSHCSSQMGFPCLCKSLLLQKIYVI